MGPCSPVPRGAHLQERSHRGGHSRKATPSPTGQRPERRAPPRGSPWPLHRRGVTVPGLSPAAGAHAQRSRRAAGARDGCLGSSASLAPGCQAAGTFLPGFPPHPKEESTDRTRPLTSYPGSPRSPGGPLAGCKTQENGEHEAAESGWPGAGAGHTHLALEGTALRRKGQGDTSESPGPATRAARAQPAGGETGAGVAMARGGGGRGALPLAPRCFSEK